MKHIALIVVLAALMACAPENEPEITPQPDATSCGGNELAHLIGQPVGTHDFAAMDRQVRILQPNAIMTQEYLPSRLNVNLDQTGLIIRLWCG